MDEPKRRYRKREYSTALRERTIALPDVLKVYGSTYGITFPDRTIWMPLSKVVSSAEKQVDEYFWDQRGHDTACCNVQLSDISVYTDADRQKICNRIIRQQDEVWLGPHPMVVERVQADVDDKRKSFAYRWQRAWRTENMVAYANSVAKCGNWDAPKPTTYLMVNIFMWTLLDDNGRTEIRRESFVSGNYPGVTSLDPFIGHEDTIVRSVVTSRSRTVSVEPVVTAPKPWHSFYYHEPSWIAQGGVMPEVLEEHIDAAFTRAYEQFPKQADNEIANAIELAPAFISLFSGNGGSALASAARNLKLSLFNNDPIATIGKLASDAWLKYRYCYSTSASDIKQKIDYGFRSPITYLKARRYDGDTVFTNKFGIDVHLHLSFDVALNSSNMLGMLSHYGRIAGIEPSLYKAWDLVPFSFMVDWFVDVGGALERAEDAKALDEYIFSNWETSLSYQTEFSDQTYPTSWSRWKVYSRWYGGHIPNRVIASANATSSRTFAKRVGDAIALSLF